jgi:hypothetical protein
MKRGLILIPAYNEADTITAVIERARAKVPELELVVVDDGSSDATSSLDGLGLKSRNSNWWSWMTVPPMLPPAWQNSLEFRY